jgi:hypothetical protein
MEEDFEYQFKSPFNMVSIPFFNREFHHREICLNNRRIATSGGGGDGRVPEYNDEGGGRGGRQIAPAAVYGSSSSSPESNHPSRIIPPLFTYSIHNMGNPCKGFL